MTEAGDERTLIDRCRQGDHAAFEKLIRPHQKMVHFVIYRMTGSTNEVEDLAQETFIQVYQHLESFRGEASFSSWIYRIVVNLCVNWQRGATRRKRLDRIWAEHKQETSPNHHSLSHELEEALQALAPKQRAAFILTTYDGLNHAEVARTMGCSETTVSWRLFAARRKLKRLLKNYRTQL